MNFQPAKREIAPATSAARAIRDTVCAALAAQPAEEEPRV